METIFELAEKLDKTLRKPLNEFFSNKEEFEREQELINESNRLCQHYD